MFFRVLIAIVTLLLLLLVTIAWFDLIVANPIYLVLFPFMISYFHLTGTPTLRLMGVYMYLSPMLLVNMPSPKMYELHGGTSFDYLINIQRFRKYGVKEIILSDYLKGLLTIISKIERKELSDSVIVKGSSYFFSISTANRLGFKVKKATLSEKLNAIMNYLDWFWMYSLARKRLTFPSIGKMKTAVIKGSELVKKREVIENILNKIEITIANNGYKNSRGSGV